MKKHIKYSCTTKIHTRTWRLS